MGKKQFCFFQTAETGNRTPDSGVKGSGANHYPRAPALVGPYSYKQTQGNDRIDPINAGLVLDQHLVFVGLYRPLH